MSNADSGMKKISVAGVISAAGSSTRLGRPKQLLKLDGRPLIDWVAAAALDSKLERVAAVLGHQAEKVRTVLDWAEKNPRFSTVFNPDYPEGMSGSVKKGLAEVAGGSDAVMFLLGDQPLITPAVINLLIDRFSESSRDICVPVYQGRRGNPVIFSQRFFPEIMSLSGDKGAREIIAANPGSLVAVEIDDPWIFFDIDREEDVRSYLGRFPGATVEWPEIS